MKCACSSASGIVGWLGVLVVIAAVVLRLQMGQDIRLLGVHTCASHLILAANTLILLAIFFRNQGAAEQK